jgi:hypothetical protein
LRRRALIGRPAEIISKLKEWDEFGVTAVGPQIQQSLTHGSTLIRRFSEHIIPYFA